MFVLNSAQERLHSKKFSNGGHMFNMINEFQLSFEGCILLLALVLPLFFLDKMSSSKIKVSKRTINRTINQ